MEDGKAEIPLNVTVQGDVLVVIYHARSTLGGRLQAKVNHTQGLDSDQLMVFKANGQFLVVKEADNWCG